MTALTVLLTTVRGLPQAISCAAAYESEWPLLIICPSSARYHWEHELLKWLDEESITKKQVTVVSKSKQELYRGVTKVVIVSYELVRNVSLLRCVRVSVCFILRKAWTAMLRCDCQFVIGKDALCDCSVYVGAGLEDSS